MTFGDPIDYTPDERARILELLGNPCDERKAMEAVSSAVGWWRAHAPEIVSKEAEAKPAKKAALAQLAERLANELAQGGRFETAITPEQKDTFSLLAFGIEDVDRWDQIEGSADDKRIAAETLEVLAAENRKPGRKPDETGRHFILRMLNIYRHFTGKSGVTFNDGAHQSALVQFIETATRQKGRFRRHIRRVAVLIK